jgi:DNA-directed RNA polymerase specialized sigma subunit
VGGILDELRSMDWVPRSVRAKARQIEKAYAKIESTEHRPPTDAELAAEVRAQRNSLLAASDWTQVLDAPVNQSAWAEYRQHLRDITAQPGFPANVIWPSKPE